MTKKIGIIGAGKVGTVLAKLAVLAGYDVLMSGSGDPKKIALTVDVLTNGAKAVTTKEVIQNNDIIILAIPLSKFNVLPAELFKNKIIIDAMNYWWEIDGQREDFNLPNHSTSQLVQEYFKDAIVVKGFNHVGYHDLDDESILVNKKDQLTAIAIAGDNTMANQKVADVIRDFGFDEIILDKLASGIKLQPGMPTFGANLNKKDLKKAIDNYQTTKFGNLVYKYQSNN